MKVLKFIVLLVVLSILSACPKIDYKHAFKFSNNSNVDVYIYFGLTDIAGVTLYPDTVVPEVRVGVLFKQGAARHYSYNYLYNEECTDVLSLFIFDADTFNIYDWNEIRSGYKVLQRYDISPEDAKMLERKISYPPDERMKDIKMFPPYGSKR